MIFKITYNSTSTSTPTPRQVGPFKQDDIHVAAAGELQAAAIKLAEWVGYT